MSATADLTAYRAWLQNRERSPGTIAKYLRDTARFFAESGAPQPPPKAAVSAWRNALAARGYAPASVNAMLAAVNACQDFLWMRKKSLEAGGPVGPLQHRDDADLYHGIRRRAPETAGTHASFAVKNKSAVLLPGTGLPFIHVQKNKRPGGCCSKKAHESQAGKYIFVFPACSVLSIFAKYAEKPRRRLLFLARCDTIQYKFPCYVGGTLPHGAAIPPCGNKTALL